MSWLIGPPVRTQVPQPAVKERSRPSAGQCFVEDRSGELCGGLVASAKDAGGLGIVEPVGGGSVFGARRPRGDVLAAILRYEREGVTSPILEALLEQRSGGGPEAVRLAADRLLREHARWALDLDQPATALVQAAGSERDRRLFRSWSLHPDGRTFEELATEEGVPRRQVNKLVRRAELRVREGLATSPAPLPWVVSTLRTRLGTVATQRQVASELDRLAARKPFVRELVTWLAGPYLPVPNRPGWVATQPKELVARTAAGLASDGGVRRLVDVETELADLGVRPDHLAAWLRASSATVVHDVAVSTSGPLADVVLRILDAHGSARSREEIAADLAAAGRTPEPPVLESALRERRFTHTSDGAVSLVEWEQSPAGTSTGAGRRGPTVGNARVKVHTPCDQAEQERLWLWVRVDGDVLRGSEASVPVALAEGLGLAPLTRRAFSSRWGPVTLSYDTLQATRGPVRAVALATGAKVVDTLLLGFRKTGDLEIEVRCSSGRTGAMDDAAEKALIFPEIVSGGTP